MPKAQLKIADHSHLPGESVVEVFHGGKFICAIYGADGPGIRITSKHPVESTESKESFGVGITEVIFDSATAY